jgi:Domain of unknown function (DUF6457)
MEGRRMEGTLYDWAAEATTALGLPPEAQWVGERDTVQQVLDLTRDIARGVARPAAPVGSFLIGVAIGLQGAQSRAALEELGARLAPTLNAGSDDES